MIEKQFNLDDFSKMLKQSNHLNNIADELIRKDTLDLMYTPLTRWQRFKYRMDDIKQRFKDIWTIVSGGDIHRNCGY
jgi:hypothetical protein